MLYPRRIIPVLAMVGLLSGCQTHRQTSRAPVYTQTTETPEERYQRRTDYVNDHYQYYIDTGRAQTADQAKALASYQWDRTQQAQRFEGTSQITNARWSSDDARKREQEAFEEDLAKSFKQ